MLFVAHNSLKSVTTLPRPLAGWEGMKFGQLIFRKIIKNVAITPDVRFKG